MYIIMRLQLGLLLLLGAVVADQTDHRHAWQTGNQYQYLVQSQTLANLNNNKNVSGIQLKGVLIVQASSPDTLQAIISKPQYAHVNTELSEDWITKIPNDLLQYRKLSLSEKPFQIKLKHGVIRELLVKYDVPTWEVNLLKSIVSQLQIDTKDKNAKMDKEIEMLNEKHPFVTYKVMEDSVGGKCEVLYDIKLSENNQFNTLEGTPMSDSNNQNQFVEIKKIKNYNKCEQQRGYHYGFSGKASLKPAHDDNDKFAMKTSTSNIIILGNLEHFTIFSSGMKSNIYVRSSQNNELGTVHSQTVLTLIGVNRSFNELSINPSKLKSTGNLVYTYHSSIFDVEQSMPYRSSSTQNSEQTQSTENHRSQSSSEENRPETNSDSIANSNNKKFERLQSVSRLDVAPENPMMPFFTDYKNQNMQMSDKINLVEAANTKIIQITDELQQPNNQPYYETLDKYIILVNMLRVFNMQQYAELEERLNRMQLENSHLNERHISNRHSDLWNVFSDAVAQAGTGPALLTITDWMKNGKLEGIQAMQIISQIPKAARAPTPQYVRAFFDLISDQKVMQQEHLNRIAPVAFSELAFNAQVNKKNSQHVYPIYSFGEMAPENDDDLRDIYIPYMETQLEKAIKDDNSPLAQAYIIALGNLGHPRILSVFEPYLEGQKSVSMYQRMLMVMTLYRLSQTNARLAKNVLYKIYLNEQEAHEVRCMAVYLYMLSNPSTVTLLRMARFTTYDKSDEVNSAVRSSIESLANLKESKFKRIASKARIARKLLSPKNYDYTYSHSYFKNKIIMETIGSDDSTVPKFALFDIGSFYSRLSQSILKAEYAVSSIKQLFEIFKKQEKDQRQSQVEKLIEKLNIQDKEPEKLEGNILFNTIYGRILYPWDNQDVEKFAKSLSEENHRVNFNHIYSYDETISFPTESGLPFSYTEETPVLIRLHATKNNEFAEKSTKISGEINMVVANKVRHKFGFAIPFERQQYQAGVDTNQQIYLPLVYEQRITEIGQNTRNCELKLHPIQSQEGLPIKVAHYSTVPFSTRRNDFDLEPVSLSKNTRVYISKEERKLSYRMGTIHVTAEITVEPNERQTMNLANQFKKVFNKPALHYNRFDVYMNNDMEVNEMNLNITYEQREINDNQAGRQSELKTARVDIVDGKSNSEARRKQVLQEISKGMKSVKVYVYDISLEISSLLPQHRQVFTIGVGKSNMDPKSRMLVYWNLQSLKDGKIKLEALGTGKMQSTRNIYLNFDEAMQNTPKDEFMFEMLIGDNYREGEKIEIEGNFMQSNIMKEIIMNSRVTRQCRQQMKQDNKQDWLPQCQEAIQIAQVKDTLKISMNTDSEHYNTLVNMALNYISKNLIVVNMNLVNPKNAGKKTVDLEMKISPNSQKAKVFVKSSEMDLVLSLPDSFEAQLSVEPNEVDDMANSGPQKLQNSQKNVCMVDERRIFTFDKKFYSIHMPQSWTVLMISKSKVPEHMKIAVMAKKKDDNIQLRMLLGTDDVELQKQNDNFFLLYNDMIPLPPGASQQIMEGDKIVATFQHTKDGILMWSNIYEIIVLYDGKRIVITVSLKYRNAIRGLCGNYNKQANNDFLTPENCVMQRPEEFVAAYSLTDNENDQSILQKKEKTNRSTCTELTYHQTNVINNREAERLTIRTWGYHLNNKNQAENLDNENAQENSRKNIINRTKVEEDDQQICFSLEPVPACPENSERVKTKLKEIAFHCMPRHEAAHELKHRIQQGANPNMSHKSVSMKHNREIPTACKATN